jgi:hypothetical protein
MVANSLLYRLFVVLHKRKSPILPARPKPQGFSKIVPPHTVNYTNFTDFMTIVNLIFKRRAIDPLWLVLSVR